MDPIWTKRPERPRRVGLLLFPRFSNLCLANCLEPMRAANALSGGGAYAWQVLTPGGGTVHSSSDLPVLGEDAGAAGRLDRLVILSSYDHLDHDTPATRALLRALARRSAEVAGFDTAPWLMAAAGLLDGRRATIHWDVLDAFAERFHRVEVERARVIADGPRVTCAGALSALDDAFAQIGRDLGQAAVLEIEGLFLRDEAASAARAAPGPRDALVRRALKAMRESLDQPLALPELARALGCQPRTLDRRCRAALGASPGTVARHLRLAHARQMVETGTAPVSEIAALCGYETATALTRAFRRRYGVAPTELRRARG